MVLSVKVFLWEIYGIIVFESIKKKMAEVEVWYHISLCVEVGNQDWHNA